MAPVIGAALAGIGATALSKPALGWAGGKVAELLDPNARAYNKQLAKDRGLLEQGKLGFSEAEKRSMLAGTQRGLQAQTAGIEANLRRQAAAAGGFGRSGAQMKALSQLAGGQQEQMAKAAGNIDALSQQTAQNRFADIMNRLNNRRMESVAAGQAIGGAASKGVAAGLRDYGRRKNVDAEDSAAYYLADAIDHRKKPSSDEEE